MFSEQVHEKYDVVISGAGPGGLALAWEAVNKGKRVLLISDRDEHYVRMQRVMLSANSREYLLEMLEKHPSSHEADQQLGVELSTYISLSIKDIERFIKRRLEFTPELITFCYQSQLSAIDLVKGECEVVSDEHKRRFKFDYIVGADGAKHHAANILNQEYPGTITYQKVLGPENKRHLYAYVTIERTDGDLLRLDKDFYALLDSSNNVICGLSLDSRSLRESQGVRVKAQFITEINPKNTDMLSELQGEKISAYISNSIYQLLQKKGEVVGDFIIRPVKASAKYGVKKDNLKIQSFATDLVAANKPAISMGDKKFLLLGDALRSPNYQIGHGMNDAFQQARWIGKILGGTMQVAAYCTLCASRLREISFKTILVNGFRAKYASEAEASATEAVDQLSRRRGVYK